MVLVGYFGTFNLNFDFLKKKYLGHPKMTKIFFFAPINTFHQHLEFFNYLEKQKSYSHQGNPDWQHFWVKREISGGRKAPGGPKIKNHVFYFLFVWVISTTYPIFSQIGDFAVLEVCHFI